MLRLLICPLKISTIFILLGIGVRQDPYYSYYIGLRNKKEESMKELEKRRMIILQEINNCMKKYYPVFQKQQEKIY